VKTNLTDDELEIYARQIVLADIGYEGQLRLRNASACLIGLGGLGSPAALALAGMGVGRLRLVDRDIVSRSDLHRQHIYDTSQIGRPKVEAAKLKLERLNPGVEIETFPEALNSRNAEELVGGMDIVLDGLDRPEPRYLLNRAAARVGIPYLFAAAVESCGNLTTIVPGRTACLECFMGDLTNRDLPTCGVVGVHPSVLGVISSLQVSEAIRILVGGQPNLADRLLHFNLRDLELTTINLRPSPSCNICGTAAPGPVAVVEEPFIEEICAQNGRRTLILTPREKIDLDMERLEELLRTRGCRLISTGPLGVGFEQTERITAYLLKSGIMISRVAAGPGIDVGKDVQDVYRDLLVEGMGLPVSILPP
jgi:adenylyltransferase/sulfurtransferase